MIETGEEVLKREPVIAILWKIKKLLEALIPEGKIVIYDKTITRLDKIDFIKEEPYRPLFSIILINKGPNPAEWSLNGGRWYTIEDFETLPEISFRMPKIRMVDFNIESGKTANIKAIGKY